MQTIYLDIFTCKMKYGLFLFFPFYLFIFLQLCETPFDSHVTTPWLKLLGDHLGRKYKIPNAILTAQIFTREFHWRTPYEEFTKN